jgi:glutamine synthetase
LAFAAILMAGLDGIKNKTAPPEATRRNVYQMTPEERRKEGITNLPSSLKEALDEMARSELMKTTLGPHAFENFIEAKSIEWEVYRSQIHQWEVDQYLGVF